MADNPFPRRRFQFRLRTLMIVVMLVAALSAAVTWVVQDRQRLIRERDEALQTQQDAIKFADAARLEAAQLGIRLKEVRKSLANQKQAAERGGEPSQEK